MVDARALPANASSGIRAGRLAIYTAFFANGFVLGSWAPKIPFFAERLGLNEGILGRMIVLFGIGALVALVSCAWLVSRYGSDRMVRWTSMALAPAIVLITLAPDIATASLTLIWLGAFIGAMDGSMNSNAVAVEKAYGRPVMSACHGYWSLGGLVGAGIGGALIERAGLLGHALTVSIIALALMMVAQHFLFHDRPEPVDAQGEKPKFAGFPRKIGVYLIGLAALSCMLPEGAVLDWSALFLSKDHNADVALSGFAYAAFSGTMALMRFGGDRVRSRMGDRTTFVVSAAIAAVGLVIAGLAPNAGIAVLGFLLSGVGMANTVPILFSAAGAYPGVPPAVGIAVATAMGYSGLLLAPAAIGFIAEHTGLAPIFSGFAVLLLMSGGLAAMILGRRIG